MGHHHRHWKHWKHEHRHWHRHGGFPFFWILGIFAFFFFAGKFILPLMLVAFFFFVLPRMMYKMQGQSWGCDFGDTGKRKNEEKRKRDFIMTPDGERLEVIQPDKPRPGVDEFV